MMASSSDTSASLSSSTPDIESVLSQITTQQRALNETKDEMSEKDKIIQQYKQEIEELRSTNQKISETNRIAMKEKFDKDIIKWVQSWPDNQLNSEYKKDILEKAESMANKGVENGVWKMLCCASNVHKSQVNEINKLTEEYNSLKGKVEGGTFRSDESRKRKEPEPAAPDVWSQLETLCKNY